ncbi:hypothetical protein L207DRAFT_584947 [Hyaloscypha variabilis F]|uniref:Uncharacterized protein n=1 Tax=Hyaloscypha variabilis (strain UAMH 11265 / GT02V1 / F) TaxID=1149755 RepID=A0A2J6RHM3_HYAVF|nr:hypothetical protein L207DRAFT_584947 [Hyaloscypha variabilis F]
MWGGGFSSFCSNGNLLETCRVLIAAGSDDVLIDEPNALAIFHGPLSTLQYLQQQMYPPYHVLSVDMRLQIASEIVQDFAARWHNTNSLVESMLMPCGGANQKIMSLPGRHGWNLFKDLIHEWITRREECRRHANQYRYSQKETQALDPSLGSDMLEKFRLADPQQWSLIGLRRLICRSISAGFLISTHQTSIRSPLSLIISEVLSVFNPIWSYRVSETLREVGDYSTTKSELTFGFGCFNPVERGCLPCDNHRHGIWFFELIGFTFGVRIEDWHFWLSEPTDEFAGDFWYMIETWGFWESDDEESDFDCDSNCDSDFDLEQAVPGAWVDDF